MFRLPPLRLGMLNLGGAPPQLSGAQLDAIALRLGDVNALSESWKQRTFGVEIELTGITFKQAFQAVQRGLGKPVTAPPSSPSSPQYTYGWPIQDETGKWEIKSDSSVTAERGGDKVEMVTPPLRAESFDKLTRVVDALCAAGAIGNKSTGIHVHVGASDIAADELKCLVLNLWKIEPLLLQAIAQYSNRQYYAKPLPESLVACVRRSNTLEQMIGCGTDRYTGLNLTAWTKYNSDGSPRRTLEFRYFNSTLNAQTVRAYVQFAIALIVHARTRCKTPRVLPTQLRTTVESPAYEMRRFLLSLGMSGPAFADARAILATALPGHPAFGTRAQADAHALRHRGAGATAPWRTEWPVPTPPCRPEPAARGRGSRSDPAPAPAPESTPDSEWMSDEDRAFAFRRDVTAAGGPLHQALRSILPEHFEADRPLEVAAATRLAFARVTILVRGSGGWIVAMVSPGSDPAPAVLVMDGTTPMVRQLADRSARLAVSAINTWAAQVALFMRYADARVAALSAHRRDAAGLRLSVQSAVGLPVGASVAASAQSIRWMLPNESGGWPPELRSAVGIRGPIQTQLMSQLPSRVSASTPLEPIVMTPLTDTGGRLKYVVVVGVPASATHAAGLVTLAYAPASGVASILRENGAVFEYSTSPPLVFASLAQAQAVAEASIRMDYTLQGQLAQAASRPAPLRTADRTAAPTTVAWLPSDSPTLQAYQRGLRDNEAFRRALESTGAVSLRAVSGEHTQGSRYLVFKVGAGMPYYMLAVTKLTAPALAITAYDTVAFMHTDSLFRNARRARQLVNAVGRTPRYFPDAASAMTAAERDPLRGTR